MKVLGLHITTYRRYLRGLDDAQKIGEQLGRLEERVTIQETDAALARVVARVVGPAPWASAGEPSRFTSRRAHLRLVAVDGELVDAS